jgi:hypothetical protein
LVSWRRNEGDNGANEDYWDDQGFGGGRSYSGDDLDGMQQSESDINCHVCVNVEFHAGNNREHCFDNDNQIGDHSFDINHFVVINNYDNLEGVNNHLDATYHHDG